MLSAEIAEIIAKSESADLVFGLFDRRGLHLDMEADISKDDLLRFCIYNVDLTRNHKREFITVILTVNPPKHRTIESEVLSFKPIIVELQEKDADAALADIREKIKNNEPVNELLLAYLPLFKSKYLTPAGLIKEVLPLIKSSNLDEATQQKIAALMLYSRAKTSSKN